ncbi:shugoshin family protein [Sporothrix schenckii 1099-18]|uniref:Shugoshin family protein n=1 Tax=Sporothrix schenckii 1099-18 TaxID=1397361 RepID=A0A0F2MBA7_SPOSC|nr:shugoshin family protein [Sporothrix schenckii 1099-18]KJR86968.1 shugoshin family protein [Sporothrix schenckii 1099-18]
MARLNESPALVDSYDNLRRKFLRQNRDIARVNSNQSLRIRGLENECARLLSENLELRGQVLRLEKEIDDNKSQRVADHALQIKQKMEAQLFELGSLLATFGLEPPTKRQSPVPLRRADKPARLSLSREAVSPLQRKPPALSPSEAESLAIQEGRLPPIYETKSFPRKTLSRDEILAIQSDDSETADSPVLGPPPVSRLLHVDSTISVDPTKKTTANTVQKAEPAPKLKTTATVKEPSNGTKVEEVHVAKVSQPAPPPSIAKSKSEPETTAITIHTVSTTAKTVQPTSAPETAAAPISAAPAAPAAVASTPSSKPAGKRKFAVNDENAVARGMKAGEANSKASAPIDRSVPTRELKNPKSIRSLVNSRKESNETTGEVKTAVGGRKPLAAKNANEDISSPRKQALNDASGKHKGGNGNTHKAVQLGGRMRNRMKSPLVVDISETTPPAAVDVKVDDDKSDNTRKPTTPLSSNDQAPGHVDVDSEPLPELEPEAPCPCTPSPATAKILTSQRLVPTHVEGRDTPPPADISSHGETSRPNRRSRASVSYAEPNLRDKMRRPTKELFDAVAGEGKYVQRQSHQPHQDGQDIAAMPTVAKSDLLVLRPHEQQSKEDKAAQAQHVTDSDKHQPRASSVGEQKAVNKPDSEAELTNSSAADQDPYEFTVASSPSQEAEDEECEASMGKARDGSRKSASSRASLKTTRRSSTTNAREDGTSSADRHTRPSAARKRASMVGMKRGSMLEDDEEDAADSSYEPPVERDDGQAIEARALSTRDRISRRRSMML